MPIYEVEYKFEDAEQRTVTRLVLFDAADEAALIVAADGMGADLDNLSACGVPEYAYRRKVSRASSPDAGSNVDPGATFLWGTALPIDPTTRIPDPVDGVKDGQGGIDIADVLVTDYTDNYLTGIARLNRNNPTQPTSVRRATLDV